MRGKGNNKQPASGDAAKPQTPQSTSPPRGPRDSSSTTTSGSPQSSITSYLEPIEIPLPAEHSLREKWQQLVAAEQARRICRANRRVLTEELTHCKMTLPGGVDVALHNEGVVELLGRQLLTKEDIRKALSVALKMQLGRDSYVSTGSGRGGSSSSTLSSSSSSNNNVESISVGQLAGSSGLVDAEEDEVADVDESPKLLELSIWALESGLCATISPLLTHAVSLTRVSRMRTLTRDEVTLLAQDKHERGLVNNIILPQDIGVTYSMIGGLDGVKQMLRQCVTYPLKYPGLYSEGIASEAVKGVLLFGPPGTGKTM